MEILLCRYVVVLVGHAINWVEVAEGASVDIFFVIPEGEIVKDMLLRRLINANLRCRRLDGGAEDHRSSGCRNSHLCSFGNKYAA